MKIFLKYSIYLALALTYAPSAAFAQSTSTPSVFDCQGSGLEAGFRQAIVDVYVPVSDAAVTRNTGNLVNNSNSLIYKECVLDVIHSRQAEAVLTKDVGSIIEKSLTGRGGAPEFASDLVKERQTRASEAMVEFIKKYNLQDNVCAPFADQAKVALARQYMKGVNDPNSSFRCALGLAPEDQERFLRGETTVGGTQGLWKLFSNPANNRWGSLNIARMEASRQIILKDEALTTQWNWGNGFYPREEIVRDPTGNGEEKLRRRTTTPAYIVSRIVEQAATSGFRRLEQADELGEIVAAAFSGLTTEIMSSPAGLTGLSQSTTGGGLSFLDRLADITLNNLRDTVASTALSRAQSAIATEQQYIATKNQTKQALLSASDRLKSTEDACWAKVVPAVQALAAEQSCTTTGGGPFGGGVTTCTAPITLNISTSSRRVSGGSADMRMTAGAALQSGTPFTLQAVAHSMLDSATLGVSVRTSTSTLLEQTISLTLNGSTNAVDTGAAASLSTRATTLFNAGTFAFDLKSGQKLPVGSMNIPLVVSFPFVQASVTLAVEAARLFADPVIDREITPLVTQTDIDIAAAQRGIEFLQAVVADLTGDTTPEVKRQAIEQLESLISSHAVHSQLDAQNAELQRSQVTGATQDLTDNTKKTWESGGNWCATDNPNVIKEWLNRWKI